MAHIKKLVMHGFKSFASKTEVDFDKEINVIVGPNGSGKSNISDGICFVLGRLSIKSMRAAKARNLIFMGTKAHKPSKEASVEMIFDNSDDAFNMPQKEISIKRILRNRGQSIYKINNETKTRQEVLALLASAGIDPHGFNIVLQGEIGQLVRMRGEERRQIIEELSGISVYEARKQKSLKELEKTDNKLKEVSTILRERTAYLRNLENERKQALRYKQLEQTVKKCKASILHREITDKEKQLSPINNELQKKIDARAKIRDEISKIQQEIKEIESKIENINNYIQETTGMKQEKLNEDISNLKAELMGLDVHQTNFQNKLQELKNKRQGLKKNIPVCEKEIAELKKKGPAISKKQEELKIKKQQFSKIETERQKFYNKKAELQSIKSRIEDKKRMLQRLQQSSNDLLEEIEVLSENLSSKNIEECKAQIKKIKEDIININKKVENGREDRLKFEKLLSILESEIDKNKELKQNITKIDVCPLCKSKMTSAHVGYVIEKADNEIKTANIKLKEIKNNLEEIDKEGANNLAKINNLTKNLNKKQNEFLKLEKIEDKKQQMKRFVAEDKEINSEILGLNEKRKHAENYIENNKDVEDKYDKAMFEIEEISARTEENIDASIMYKERELENLKNIIKRSHSDEEEIKQELDAAASEIDYNEHLLEEKEAAAREIAKKFKKLFDDKTKLREKIKNYNINILNKQNSYSGVENSINNLKIERARINAEKEALSIEYREFEGIELIKANKEILIQRQRKSEEILARIGNVNLRALEIYDSIKKEYDVIAEKVENLNNEKEEILKIVIEIDKKKKRTFMKMFKAINELFSRNFSQLSQKGKAFLEIENKEDIFTGGINITIKVGKGKYLDVASLSGGEQTLVALSLIFAIQEHRPYHFYVLDEIDAALDKRNSARLATLIKKYMEKGQYIITTHNDAIIQEASILYGVSMHNGISKVLGLKV